VYKTEAIVLGKTRLGEADSLLTLFTPYRGKLKAVAKGSERPQSKLSGHVQLLSYSSMLLAQGQSLDIITQSQVQESFLPLQQDLWRLSSALYAAELVDRFTPEQLECRPLFLLLLDTLRWLCEARKEELALRYFELHLLEHLGYRPQLRRCVGCRSPLTSPPYYFSPAAGGVLCSPCRRRETLIHPLSLPALRTLQVLQDAAPAAARRLRAHPSLAMELEQVLKSYISYLLEREVNSARWLERLRAQPW
jgi:DNA repair protein RecO (recombination protein O)